MLFPVDKKSVSTCRNEQLAEKYIPVEEWVVFADSNWLLSEKMEKKWFPPARKSVVHLHEQSSPSRNFFLKIGFSLISMTLSTSRMNALESVPSQNNVTF